jgi:hypothetical protein
MTNGEVLEEILAAGKKKFGDEFHFSMTYAINVQPFL